MSELPVFIGVPTLDGVSIVAADSTNAKTIVTASGGAVGITAMWAATDDATVTQVLNVFISTVGSGDVYRGSVPLTQPSTDFSETNLMDLTYMPGLNPFTRVLILPSGASLKCSVSTTVNTGDTVYVGVEHGSYV